MGMKITDQIVLAGCIALLASPVFAADGDAGSRKSDTPDTLLTVEEIVAAPRPKTVKTAVPEDAGIYIGSGVYGNKGKLKMTGC